MGEIRNPKLPYEITPNHGRDIRDWVNEPADGQPAVGKLTHLRDRPHRRWPEFAELVAVAQPIVASQVEGVPEIVINTEEERVADEAIAALQKLGGVYQRGGRLVHVVVDNFHPRGIVRKENAPRIADLPPPRLRELMASAAKWSKANNDGDLLPAHPPLWAVNAVQARGQWKGIQHLEAIVECPILKPDGTILETPGYDADTAVIYMPNENFPAVPKNPTHADALAAAAELLAVVHDFSFEAPEHQAAWLASVLTPFGRHAFAGPSPLNLIDANVPGAGKGLLTDVTATIAFGRPMPRMAAPINDDEFRKKITTIAFAAETAILIDNVAGSLGSPSFDAALTSCSWTDRMLGENTQLTLPLSTIWYATGNNIVLAGDTPRRTLHIRLNVQVENPEQRTDFEHPDLHTWVKENRPRLAVAALTIMRAYFVAGRPDQQLPPWGSFQGWSNLIRESITWLGMVDPGVARQKMTEQANDEANFLRRFLAGWEEIDPAGHGMTVTEASNLVYDEKNSGGYEILRQIFSEIPAKNIINHNRSIGMKLRKLRCRVAGGKFFDFRDSKLGNLWFVAGTSPSKGGTRGTRGTNTLYPTIFKYNSTLLSSNNDSECNIHKVDEKVPVGVTSPSSPSSPSQKTLPEPCRCGGLFAEVASSQGVAKFACQTCGLTIGMPTGGNGNGTHRKTTYNPVIDF